MKTVDAVGVRNAWGVWSWVVAVNGRPVRVTGPSTVDAAVKLAMGRGE